MAYLVTIPFDNVTLAATANADLLHLTLGTNKGIIPVELEMAQFSEPTTEEETLRIGIYRGVTGGSGGTALTEVLADANNTSTIGTAAIASPTTSTGGTLVEVIPWNVRQPLLWAPIPEARAPFHVGTSPVAFRVIGAPADAMSVSGTLKVLEGL